jgi:hypothetical protein
MKESPYRTYTSSFPNIPVLSNEKDVFIPLCPQNKLTLEGHRRLSLAGENFVR